MQDVVYEKRPLAVMQKMIFSPQY